MRKEFIIGIIIIVCIIIGNIITQRYTKKSVEGMNEKLEELRESVIQQNEKEAGEKMKDLTEYWNEKYNLLSYYIEHDELEKVGVEMKILNTNIEIKEYELAAEKIDKSIFLLEHIEDKNSLTTPNIF